MLLANKRVGETPLELIHRLREMGKIPKGDKATYAGRLDPLASGLMLILTGEEVKEKDQYLSLDKIYETDILFGVATDSYDPLGLITSTDLTHTTTKQALKFVLIQLKNLTSLPYPPYSSRTVNGKPLWQWARENRLSEITIPDTNFQLFDLQLTNLQTLPLPEITSDIISSINKVQGDFRQPEITKAWQQLTHAKNNPKLSIASLTIHCSSGTYIRSLAHHLGQLLGTGAIASRIHRTQIGQHSL